jgi:peptidoglycan/xylan/chitin deacetylase (PgdA/CDA1 family)
MKHISTGRVLSLGVGFLSALLLFPFLASAQAVNLIANPGIETAGTAGVPAGWTKNFWGSPTPTFTYPATGNAGTKGASVTLGANSTGDARWQHAAVAVEAGATYTYTIWYNSTAPADIDAEYTNTSGRLSYAWFASLPSSGGAWKQATVTIKIPTGITKASVYVLLSQKGILLIDDAMLFKGTVTPPPPPPPLPSLTFSASPLSVLAGSSTTLTWNSTNTVTCTATGGWTGAKSVSGSQTIAQTATTTYILTCANASGTSTSVQVTVGIAVPLPPPPPTPPTLTFTVSPQVITQGSSATLSWSSTNATSCTASQGWSGAKAVSGTQSVAPSATTTYALNCIGTGGSTSKQVVLGVVPAPVVPPTPGVFSEGMVTFSFDDSWLSQYTGALPVLQTAGYKGTFYLTTEPLVQAWDDFMTPAQVQDIAAKGHEIAGHTVTHPHLPQLSQTQINNEIKNSKTYLESLTGKTVSSLAYPYGELNATVKTLTQQAGYSSGRGVSEDALNTAASDKYDLKSSCILNNTSLASIKAQIDKAKANKQWYILCMHEVRTLNDPYAITVAQFQQIVDYVKSQGVKVVTVEQGRALMAN